MSNPSAVTRTAPIAIAPKPPRRQNSYLQEAFTNLELFRGGSMPGREIAESVGSYTTRSLSPCESCQRSRVKCIVSEDEDSCIPCQASGSDCSLLNSPQPRKRKLNGDFDDSGKRRSVCSIFPSSHVFSLTPLSYLLLPILTLTLLLLPAYSSPLLSLTTLASTSPYCSLPASLARFRLSLHFAPV